MIRRAGEGGNLSVAAGKALGLRGKTGRGKGLFHNEKPLGIWTLALWRESGGWERSRRVTEGDLAAGSLGKPPAPAAQGVSVQQGWQGLGRARLCFRAPETWSPPLSEHLGAQSMLQT